MAQLGQAQVGTLKSTPKLTKINGDDDKKVIYRNLGNNHAYPFVWASTATVSGSDTSVLIADGIKWHGYDLAAFATVIATPKTDLGHFFTTADTENNTITFNCENPTTSGGEVALMFMLGREMIVEGLACRGNTGAAQSLP